MHHRPARSFKSFIAPGLLVFSLICTGLIVLHLKRKAEQEARRECHLTCDEVEETILARLRAGEQVLRSGVALFNASPSVDREQWRTFVEGLRIEQHLPGIQGVGFATLIPRDALAAHEQAIRHEGFPAYQVRPAGERELYTAIVYLEPFVRRNLRAFGYDMFSEPVRRTAMERARDENRAALSGRVILMQETDQDVQAGTLLYFPVYERGVPLESIEARRAAIRGWVYSPYRMTDLLRGALRGWNQLLEERRIGLHVYDGDSLAEEHLLHGQGETGPAGGPAYSQQRTISFGGHRWTLRFTQHGGLAGTTDYGSTWIALLGGTAVSLLAFGLTWSLQRTGQQAEQKAGQLTQRLRQATERLALATRTGGVGVWDYDVQRHRLVWDEQMYLLYGLSPDCGGMAYEDWLSRLHPEDRARIDLEVKNSLQQASDFDTEFRAVWPDGSTHHIRAFGKVEFDAAGGVAHLLGTNWDITLSKQAELALRASAEATRATFEQAAIGIAHVSPDGRFLRVNRRLCEIAARTERELLGLHFQEITHPDDVRTGLEMVERMLRGEIETYTLEKRYVRKDGGIVPVSLSVSLARDEHGAPSYFISIVRDISARLEAERARSELLERLTLIAENVPGVIYEYCLRPDGTSHFPYASPGLRDIYGVAPEAVAQDATPVFQVLHAGDLSRVSAKILESARNLTVWRDTYRVNLPTGQTIWVQGQSKPQRRPDGSTLWHGYIYDITDRHRATERMDLLNTALQAVPAGIIITDKEGRIEWANRGFSQLTGYDSGAVLGRNPRLLKSGRHDAVFYAELWQTIKRGKVWNGELVNRREDGTEYHEQMTIAPVTHGGDGITHYIAIKQDITEQKKMEQQFLRAQRMEGIGLLASGIAHDLNNVLAPVLLSVELLRVRCTNPLEQRTLEVIESSARRGAGIVRQVLTFARGIDGNRIPLRPQDIVRELVLILEETFPRDISIRREVADKVPVVLGDATQLHQVLLNLALNARDAMPNGGALTFLVQPVHLEKKRVLPTGDLPPGDYVLLGVRDTGQGMGPEVRERVFEPFFTTKPSGKGTGLGLPTVLGIVRSHGGAVDVDTSPGTGSSFRVYLPAVSVESADAAVSQETALLEGCGRTVLVCDDEPPIREIARVLLLQSGFNVLEAENGREALARFEEQPARIDAVVMDLMMPLMTGDRAAAIMLERRPGLPVLFMSGLMDQEAIKIALKRAPAAGIVLLKKPFTAQEFRAALLRVLAPSRADSAPV